MTGEKEVEEVMERRRALSTAAASEMSPRAAVSMMLRTTKRLMALSLPTQRPQFEHRVGFTCPRPFFARPWLRRLTVILCGVFVLKYGLNDRV